jgi:hypothetical protein
MNIMREDRRLAWAMLWTVANLNGHKLVAIPKLYIEQEPCLDLTNGMPYAQVFKGSTMSVLSLPPREFAVVHANFALYRTAEPLIEDFACIIPEPGQPLPPHHVVITKTADMLRGK